MPSILTWSLLIVVLAAALEGVVLSLARRRFDWHSFGASMGNLLMRLLVTRLLPLSLAAPLLAWAYQHRLFRVELDHAAAFALLFVGQEFCYYWFHRCSHRVRWFWINHSVHHSPNDFTWVAALRAGVLGRAMGTTVFFAPLVWIGFAPQVVVAALTLNLLYQFWIHAEWIPKLGWLEWILNTPSAHRVHHAANLEYLDANYGGVLIVFDHLFGTYRAEQEGTPIRYGLVEAQLSHNPLTIELAAWRNLARDLRGVRSVRELAGTLFAPPGWRPDGLGETTEALRARAMTQAQP